MIKLGGNFSKVDDYVPVLLYTAAAIFTVASYSALSQKYISLYVSLPHSHDPSTWNHGNQDIYCVSHKASYLISKSDHFANIYLKISGNCISDSRVVYSLASTYLYYVIDQRVAEHPVQVDALILQNVLEKQTEHGTDSFLQAKGKRSSSCFIFWTPERLLSSQSSPEFILWLHTEPPSHQICYNYFHSHGHRFSTMLMNHLQPGS